jgi:UDP-N-acetylmuramate dehydrogenase
LWLGWGGGAAGISTNHTRAHPTGGAPPTADLLDLAREIRDGVEQRFGIRLVNEPVLVGVDL